jgi:hypothetical protein
MSRPPEGSRRTNTFPMRIGGVGLLLVLLTGACDQGPRNVTIPTKAASPSSSATSTEDAIRHSYMQYWAELPLAERAGSEARSRQLLAPYVTDPLLGTVLDNIEKLHARKQASWGSVVVHIQDVQVKGDTAIVRDCQDSSNAGLLDTRSNKKTSRGVPKDPWRATLVRGADGRWRVKTFTPLAGC